MNRKLFAIVMAFVLRRVGRGFDEAGRASLPQRREAAVEAVILGMPAVN